MAPQVFQVPVQQVRHRLGYEYRAAEFLGQRFNPARLVHRTADDGEIESFRGTHVAEENFSQVLSDSGAQRAPAVYMVHGSGRLLIESANLAQSLFRRRYRPAR